MHLGLKSLNARSRPTPAILEPGFVWEAVFKFPASWEYTGYFVRRAPPEWIVRPESRAKFNDLRANSLRIGTGNLFRPSRELNRVIRELIRLIRESLDLTGDFNPQVKELHLSGGDPLARRNLPELQRAS